MREVIAELERKVVEAEGLLSGNRNFEPFKSALEAARKALDVLKTL